MFGQQQQQPNPMQDYIARYSTRLNELLGYTPPGNLGAPTGGGPMLPANTEPLQPGQGVSGEGPPMVGGASNLGAQMQPTQAPAPGPQVPMTDFNPAIADQRMQRQLKKNAEGKVIIDSRPKDFDFGVKDEDLKDAKTVGDLVQAMPPKKADEYMTWWEQQYGDINSKYDAMLEELGERPDPTSRQLSRKDKFTLLMEFGLNLMKASQQGGDRTGAIGAAIHDTVRGDQARREKDFERHRSLTGEIEGRRSKELQAIGSRGDAMTRSQNLGAAAAQEERAATEFAGRDDEIKQVIYGDQGVVGITRTGEGRTIKDEAGQPVKSTLGVARGRSGSTGSGYAPSDPEKRARFYSEVYKVPLDVATDLVRAEKSQTDPFKMYSTMVNRLLAQYFEQDEAARVARELVEGVYGAGALDNRPGAPRAGAGSNLGATTPPADRLKQGRVTTFANGQKWTLDENGQPKQVR